MKKWNGALNKCRGFADISIVRAPVKTKIEKFLE